MAKDDCCQSDAPGARENPPGLAQLQTRHSQPVLFQRMLAALASARVEPISGLAAAADPHPLRALTARDSEDPSVALLDAWACACDVLSFYSERILNEGYLPTAQEYPSLAALARALGYEPSPGVAASTRLAFRVDANAPDGRVTIPVGLEVASVPAQHEQPQSFETIETIEALAEHNELRAAVTRRQHLTYGTRVVWLAGSNLRLARGDALVFLGRELDTPGAANDERWDFRFVAQVDVDAANGITRVTLDRELGADTAPAQQEPFALVFRRRAALFGYNAPNPALISFPEGVSRSDWIETLPGGGRARHEWKGFTMAADEAAKRGEIDLDREYEGIVNGSWVVLQSGLRVELYRVRRASPRQRSDFGLAAKHTRLTLDDGGALSSEDLTLFERRSTTVFLDSEVLHLAEAPWTDAASGRFIELDREVTPLPKGRWLILTGISTEGAAVVHETTARGTSVAGADVLRVAPRSVLELDAPLPASVRRESLRVLANVALATHGSSVNEALGHGDASNAHVQMRLRQGPLTWLSAATPSGRESTLELHIQGLPWVRTESLYQHGPTDRVYQLRTESDGVATVVFGDGLRGARPPSGIENVRVRYRKGIGVGGEVKALGLSMLPRPPAGLRGVHNPRAAEGGADPESVDEIRANANLRVLSLDRLVSVQDYEDFARAFAGIGKARAVELWNGKRSFVHLTVASSSGQPLSSGSETMRRLSEAIARFADPSHVPVVSSFTAVPFRVALAVLRSAAFEKEAVGKAVVSALFEAFSFARRSFGGAVTYAEILSVVHSVPGVVAVQIDALHRASSAPAREARLDAAQPRWAGGSLALAELLLVEQDGIALRWIDS